MQQAVKIVVLDGGAMNPGDLSWAPLEALGELRVHDSTAPNDLAVRADNADVLLTNKVVITADTIRLLPKLRYIGITATGTDAVDLCAARAADVVVTRVPAYSTASVAQMVFAHVLNITRRVSDHAVGVSSGAWSRNGSFCYWEHDQHELSGKVLGIIGYGQTGQAVARIGAAFGMQVIVHTRTPTDKEEPVAFVDLDTVFAQSDILSLHCPLTPETEQLVNAARLETMKPSAILINAARGRLVDEAALADALQAGRPGAAGLDVLASEPPADDCPLLGAPNCWITPHMAWATVESRQRLLHAVAANLRSFLAGTPENVVRG